MKVESKNKAIKVAPVDISKLGNPRSRKPVIQGEVTRVSDLRFISNADNEITITSRDSLLSALAGEEQTTAFS